MNIEPGALCIVKVNTETRKEQGLDLAEVCVCVERQVSGAPAYVGLIDQPPETLPWGFRRGMEVWFTPTYVTEHIPAGAVPAFRLGNFFARTEEQRTQEFEDSFKGVHPELMKAMEDSQRSIMLDLQDDCIALRKRIAAATKMLVNRISPDKIIDFLNTEERKAPMTTRITVETHDNPVEVFSGDTLLDTLKPHQTSVFHGSLEFEIKVKELDGAKQAEAIREYLEPISEGPQRAAQTQEPVTAQADLGSPTPPEVQQPSVGRIVHFYSSRLEHQSNGGGEGPYAAMITRVFSPTMVNLTVFMDATGDGFPMTSVGLGESSFDYHWEWPPRI